MLLLFAASLLVHAPLAGTKPPAAQIIAEDANRFAELFMRTNGKPTAEQIQAEYLDPGSYAVKTVLAPRIGSAAAMARSIAAKPELYRKAIETCLPAARDSNADLQAIYARYDTLFPGKRLPRVYLAFGSGNTGGTADGSAQVLGLEVMCAMVPDAAAFKSTLRTFLAHEAVHALQAGLVGREFEKSPLLATVLMEGAADLLALEVTGSQPDPARAAWAEPRRAELMRQFREDVAATRGWSPATAAKDDPRHAIMARWVWNYRRAPEGWPAEAGYWIGQQLWTACLTTQRSRKTGLRELLRIRDAEAVLAATRPSK